MTRINRGRDVGVTVGLRVGCRDSGSRVRCYVVRVTSVRRRRCHVLVTTVRRGDGRRYGGRHAIRHDVRRDGDSDDWRRDGRGRCAWRRDGR